MSKYNRTRHAPWSPGFSEDDEISKDISNLLNRPVVITEKCDGENQALTNQGVYARSHGDFTRHPWAVKMWELWQRIGRDISDDTFIFGENMYAIHSIEYNELKSYFYMFACRENTRWYSWIEVEETAYLLDIPTVPVLYKGIFKTEQELKDKVLEFVKQPSRLGSTIMEGVVVRIEDSFDDEDFSTSVIKWVRPNHVTTDQHWTRNWKKAKLIR